MKIEQKNINSFIVEEGITKIHLHIEKYRGVKQLWVDKIEIHGSVALLPLIMRLKRIYKYFEEKHHII